MLVSGATPRTFGFFRQKSVAFTCTVVVSPGVIVKRYAPVTLALAIAASAAHAQSPRAAEDHHKRGLVLGRRGEFDRAIAEFDKAIELSPHHPGWFHFGIVLNEYRQRHYVEALAVLQKLNMPQYWVFHFVKAIIHGQLGNRQEAQTAVERTHAPRRETPRRRTATRRATLAQRG